MAKGKTNYPGGGVDTSDADAGVADILSPKTAYGSAGTKLTGTMVDRGTVNITPSTSDQAISAGKHSGSGVVYGDADLVAGNIKNAVNIFGVVGTYDYEGTSPMAAGTVVSGKIGFVNGAKITGTLVLQKTVRALLIAGGGGGGKGAKYQGAGGGGGGFVENDCIPVTLNSAYTIVIGGGGGGATTAGATGTNGGNSTALGFTATGGGGGAGGTAIDGNNGGCGGGGSATTAAGKPGEGIYQGRRGGVGTASGTIASRRGGGGGGQGAVGVDSATTSGGGAGRASSISGASVTYGGGGGGAGSTANNGGAGGGGNGYTFGTPTPSTAGTVNTGGGGGGGIDTSNASAGGSGVVLIRWLTADFGTNTVTGGGAITTDGSYKVATFTSDGTITFVAA